MAKRSAPDPEQRRGAASFEPAPSDAADVAANPRRGDPDDVDLAPMVAPLAESPPHPAGVLAAGPEQARPADADVTEAEPAESAWDDSPDSWIERDEGRAPSPMTTGAVLDETESGSDVLEELTLPSTLQALPPLPPDTVVDPEQRLRIVRLLETRGRMNRYRAIWTDDAGQEQEVELREAPLDHAELRREATVLLDVQYAMLPRRFAAFERDDRQYLAIESLGGDSLEQAIAAGLAPDAALAVVLQLTQALRRLHHAGWA